MRLSFKQVLQAWNTEKFDTVLKQQLQALTHRELPLQEGLSLSSIALDDKIDATILRREETEKQLVIKAGLFYQGIIAGCSCSDDPSPTDLQNEYCEVLITVDKDSADVSICLAE